MAYVECTVNEGLRPLEATVSVMGTDGRRRFLRVERDFVRNDHLLPVGIVHKDLNAKRSLIELPHESDSGENRVWVKQEQIQEN